ncbi:rolling circle replication-associated protein [Clostridium perfringens]|uniref:rolling circle replication-associated protein n=1 Tax=Clostridium perfringens TaxID=1502 RepID=UPI00374F4963
MPYREKQIENGMFLDVEIFPITFMQRKCRGSRKKESLPKQKNLNDKNSKKYLARTLNTNFTEKDYFVTLGYTDFKRPSSYDRALKDLENFFKRLRRYLRKHNKPELKYIYVIEYDDDINIHFHIVMNGIIDISELERIWGNGNIEVSKLRIDDLGYESLAKYLTKDPKGKRRWNPSRNLKRPEIVVEDFKYNPKKVREIATCQGDKEFINNLYPGHILKSFEVNFNEINSSFYINIKLQKFRDRRGTEEMYIPNNISSGIENVLNRVDKRLKTNEYREKLEKSNKKNKCPLCSGKNMIYNNYSKRYSKCKCQGNKNIARALHNFSYEELNKNFKNFNYDTAEATNIKNTTTNYYLRFEKIENNKSNSLALLGTREEVRTHLLLALFNKLTFNDNRDIEYISINKPLRLEKEDMKRYRDVELLIINNFLEGKESKKDINSVIEVLEYRSKKRLPIILGSSLNLEEIKKFNSLLGDLVEIITKDNLFNGETSSIS